MVTEEEAWADALLRFCGLVEAVRRNDLLGTALMLQGDNESQMADAEQKLLIVSAKLFAAVIDESEREITPDFLRAWAHQALNRP